MLNPFTEYLATKMSSYKYAFWFSLKRKKVGKRKEKVKHFFSCSWLANQSLNSILTELKEKKCSYTVALMLYKHTPVSG